MRATKVDRGLPSYATKAVFDELARGKECSKTKALAWEIASCYKLEIGALYSRTVGIVKATQKALVWSELPCSRMRNRTFVLEVYITIHVGLSDISAFLESGFWMWCRFDDLLEGVCL